MNKKINVFYNFNKVKLLMFYRLISRGLSKKLYKGGTSAYAVAATPRRPRSRAALHNYVIDPNLKYRTVTKDMLC